MNAETPKPQPPREINRADVIDELSYRFKEADPDNAIAWVLDELAELDILRFRGPALCAATEGATGIRCQQPTGHVDGHKGTTTEQQTAAVGYPLFVSWPAEPEHAARRSVRVENTPNGLSISDRQKVADLLVAGKPAEAVATAHAAGLDYPAADAYVRQMSEYETYLNHHGRTEVDPTEADRMRAMGFDRQPEFKVSDDDRASIQAVLDERTTEYVYGQDDGSWKLDGTALTGVVADIVWAAIRRDRERGDR